ncbi:Hypothetical protein LBF_0988 [Leptospira biflexa serovar Patoc strain 'Patoc 1 (Ames)']|uniref:Uncharacterized protein n=1 Tax=Leptospira biflexa serovar Patoc (strain Patoc 1 / ATCC 23582 / Paris) TaxID=456481 RepID=B0SMK1_LEPBP|nr:Hypothetical protein LBF_0988 [Leptospira biflexa serovar Patoc strain 'Patoc 1 (Ames)']ABZ97145.1 Hypothetical protein; putative signal peptide [Leptospira biflexa serovar Patoc strain 'Patoc 1 (Paris)']
MNIRLSFLGRFSLSILTIGLFLSVSMVFAHESLEDRPLRFFFHCGKDLFTKMDEEGRGGLSALLGFVEREKMDLDLKRGKGYMLYPFGKKDKPLEFPFDGFHLSKTIEMEHGPVKLGLGSIEGLITAKNTEELDGWIVYVGPDEETKIPLIPWQNHPDLPIFLLVEKKPQARFRYLSNVHQIECPKDYGRLGTLNLFFRKRNLIRMDYKLESINLTDRNRSWKQRKESETEEGLEQPIPNKKDIGKKEGNPNKMYGEPGNTSDREILGKEIGFGKFP